MPAHRGPQQSQQRNPQQGSQGAQGQQGAQGRQGTQGQQGQQGVVAPGMAHMPKMIRRGSSGAEVRMCQTLLNKVGLAPGPADGIFGPATHRAVVQFQEKRGLEVDGIVGPQTWAGLRERSGMELDTAQYGTPQRSPGGDQQRGGSQRPQPEPGQRPGRRPPANPRDEAQLRQEILRVAESQIGTTEKGENRGGALKYQQFFGRGPEPWCADFVSWVYSKAGKSTNSPYCPTFVQQLKKQGRWKGKNDPQPGDLVFFDWDHDKNPDHVGIVKAVNADGSITTIEGNTANPRDRGQEGVYQKVRGMETIFGFGEVA